MALLIVFPCKSDFHTKLAITTFKAFDHKYTNIFSLEFNKNNLDLTVELTLHQNLPVAVFLQW